MPPIKIQERRFKKDGDNLSLCSTLRVEHSLGGYSHREHCRAPDRKIQDSKNILTWPLGVAKGSGELPEPSTINWERGVSTAFPHWWLELGTLLSLPLGLEAFFEGSSPLALVEKPEARARSSGMT